MVKDAKQSHPMNPQNERLRPEEELTPEEMQRLFQSLPSVEENPPIECKPEERILPKPDSK